MKADTPTIGMPLLGEYYERLHFFTAFALFSIKISRLLISYQLEVLI